MTDRQPAGFDATWDVASAIPGWLTQDQARLLFDTARELPSGPLVVEIGSHQGRSTVVLASAAAGSGARSSRSTRSWKAGCSAASPRGTKFEQTSPRPGWTNGRLLAEYSTRARPAGHATIDMLYIDGKHDYWTFATT